MGSRALLVRFINNIAYNNNLCKRFSYHGPSPTTVKFNKLIVGKNEESNEVIKKNQINQGKITVESEENAVGMAYGVSGEVFENRTVYISQPPKNAMQSGTNNIHVWQISFDAQERWENPLMGWCSSADPVQGLIVNFDTKEKAIEHCKSMGWKYIVQKPNLVDPKPRSYGENFSWNKRTRVTTK